MGRTALTLLALLGMAAGIDCRAESVFVNLLPGVQVDRTEIRLADIAQMASRDPAAAERLGATVVATCSTLSQPCHLEKAGLLSAIQAHAAQQGTTLLWGANETVTVTGRRRQLPLAPAIERAAARILQQMDPTHPIALGIKETPAAIEAPPGTATFRPEFDQMRRFGTMIDLPITVLVDGVTVARPLVRYVLQRVGTAFATDSPVRGEDQLEQKQARVQQTPGRSSTSWQKEEHDLGSDVAIARNKKIRLLIASGPVQVETEGTALSNAAIGTLVDVRRINGLADVRGRVIDSGTVLVEGN